MEPIRVDYTGYEGMFVAIGKDGEIVLADEDYHRLCDRLLATGLNKGSAVWGPVPRKGEPRYRIGV